MHWIHGTAVDIAAGFTLWAMVARRFELMLAGYMFAWTLAAAATSQ